jgi:DNA polymerase-3 subunit gamma/tau
MAIFGASSTGDSASEVVDLHVKYRPTVLDAVIGQDATVNSIKGLFKENKIPHAILFTGPSGTGKTTLARIIARTLKVHSYDILERDAAIYSGVEDMRHLIEGLKYTGMGGSGIKFIILDECHQLSKASWNSILKELEEPPIHVYWVLCTTDPTKVPDTIKTRCHSYTLKSVKLDDLRDLLDYVCAEEKIILPEGAAEIIARNADGSPRKALVGLSQSRHCQTKEDVIKVLESIDNSGDVLDLCRLLVDRGPRWEKVKKIFTVLKDANPEGIRIQIVGYLMSCILKANLEKETARFLTILQNFDNPIYHNTGMATLMLSVGNVILNDE